MRSYLALLLSLLFPFLAHAAAAPVAFAVVPDESSIRFEVQRDTAVLTGQFPQFTAKIAFHPDALADSSAAVTVDMGSVTVGDAQAQDMLATQEWLNLAGFSTAVFATVSFKALGGNRYEAVAKLTIKGATLPVVLTFTLDEFSGQAAAISGEAVVHRKDFRIGWDDTASVADQVKVLVTLKATAIPAH